MKKQLSPSTKTRLIAIAVSTVMMLLVAMSILTFIYVTKPQAPTVAVDGNDNPYNNVDYYDMPSNLIFTANTTTAEQAYKSVNLRVTISPDSATDKRLEWSAEFANPNSDWAKDKVVSNYVTAETDNQPFGPEGRVTCWQPFGEQIIITVKSINNPNAKASCTLDFASRVKGIKVSYGDDIKPLFRCIGFCTCGKCQDGITEEWEQLAFYKFNVNENGKPTGGAISYEYILSDTYTIEDNFIHNITLSPVTTENRITFGMKDISFTSDILLANDFNKSFIIDYELLNSLYSINTSSAEQVYFRDLTKSEKIDYLSNITNGTFLVLRIEIEGEKYSSWLNQEAYIYINGYIDYAEVSDITFQYDTRVI